MIIATCTPFGRMPVRMTVLISASVQLPMPVSLSGVMFGAVTLNGGSSQDRPPEKSLPATAAGGPFGEWQLAQVKNAVDEIVASLDQIRLRSWPALASAAESMPHANKTVRIVMNVPPEPSCCWAGS